MMTAALLAPAPEVRPRCRGRIPVSTIPAERQRHIDAARYRVGLGVPLDMTADLMNVSPRTVQLWIAKARAYPEAAHLFREDAA